MTKRLVAVSAALLLVASAIAATPAGSAAPSPATSVAPGGSYVALTPARILDTRSGLGAPAGATQQVTVNTAGVVGIPTDGVSAVAVNLAVSTPAASGSLVAYAAGASRPATTNMSYVANQTLDAMAIVPVNATGAFTVYSQAKAQLIADVLGYFTTAGDAATSSGLFTPVTAARIMDTRSHLGGTAPGPGGTVTLTVTGTGGVPASGVSAVVVNTTAVNPTATGYVTAYPTGSGKPATGTIRFDHGTVRSNRAIIPVGPGGKITFYNSAGTTNLLVDVNGYFSSAGSYYVARTPTRVLDSRSSARPWSTSVRATNMLGVTIDAGSYPNETGRAQSIANVAPTTAVWLTLTGVNPTSSGFATATPSTSTQQIPSDLNPVTSRVTSNAAVVAPGADGNIRIYSSAAQQFIVDLDGYFAARPANPTTAGVWGWGGSLPDGTFAINSISDVTAIVTDASGYEYARRADGSLIAWVDPTYTNDRLTRHTFHYDVSSDVTQLAGTQVSGGSAVYALHSDGTIRVWGHDHYGEFGDGSQTDNLFITFSPGDGTMAPTSGQVQLNEVTLIGAGPYTGYAMRSDGTVWAWGSGTAGQLGNGTTSDSRLPVQVTGLSGIRSIAGGPGPAYAIDGTGHLWRWGRITTSGGSQTVTVPAQVSIGCADGASLFTHEYGSWERCTDGTVWRLDDAGRESAGGTTFAGPVPSLTGITALGAARFVNGDHRSTLQALSADGRVWRFDPAAGAYAPIPGLSGITTIGGGGANGRAVYAVAGG